MLSLQNFSTARKKEGIPIIPQRFSERASFQNSLVLEMCIKGAEAIKPGHIHCRQPIDQMNIISDCIQVWSSL